MMRMRNPLPHLCVDCGLLYRREAAPGSPRLEVGVDRRRRSVQADAEENRAYVWGCRHSVWAEGKPERVWRAEVAKSRYCPYFIAHVAEADPESHLDMARAKLWERKPVGGVGLAVAAGAGLLALLIVLATLVGGILD